MTVLPENTVSKDWDMTYIDSDSDSIPDLIEGYDPENPLDTDGDENPDYLDWDSDNDTLWDWNEVGSDPYHPLHSDDDGIPNFQDTDSDNDGIPDQDDPFPTVPNGTAIPTVSEWGMIALAMLLLAGAFVVMRRRTER